MFILGKNQIEKIVLEQYFGVHMNQNPTEIGNKKPSMYLGLNSITDICINDQNHQTEDVDHCWWE